MTGKRILLIPIVLSLVGCGFAQSLTTYLTLRKQYGIHRAVEVDALETLVGTRVMELQGRVKGTFQVNGRYSLLVERSDFKNETVDTDAIPDWLSGGNNIPARLIIRAYRKDENSGLRAVLIAAAPESDIAPIERAEIQRQQDALARKRKSDAQLLASKPATKDWNLPSSEATPIYAAFIKKINRRLSNAQAMEIASGIIGFSLKYGVDARLIMAMVMTESSFDPTSTSHAGAMGLGQLMPSNVREMGLSNAYDTMQNLSATVRLVRGHLEQYQSKYNSLVLSLAAYNAGPGAVRKYGGVPPYRETQNYVKKVLNLYRQFCGQ